MRVEKSSFFLALFILFAFSGCQPAKDDGFAIYLLAQDIPATELSKIDINQLTLESRPLISSDDVTSYHKTNHIIELTPAANTHIQQIFPKPVRVDGIPFVVCIGDERIYAGAFWTPVSSLSYDGVVIMQPWDTKETTIQIALGYPGPDAFTGTDPRADPRIMRVLERDNKLK